VHISFTKPAIRAAKALSKVLLVCAATVATALVGYKAYAGVNRWLSSSGSSPPPPPKLLATVPAPERVLQRSESTPVGTSLPESISRPAFPPVVEYVPVYVGQPLERDRKSSGHQPDRKKPAPPPCPDPKLKTPDAKKPTEKSVKNDARSKDSGKKPADPPKSSPPKTKSPPPPNRARPILPAPKRPDAPVGPPKPPPAPPAKRKK